MNYIWTCGLKMLYFTLLSVKSIFPWLFKQIFTSFRLVNYMGKKWHELVLLAFVFCQYITICWYIKPQTETILMINCAMGLLLIIRHRAMKMSK